MFFCKKRKTQKKRGGTKSKRTMRTKIQNTDPEILQSYESVFRRFIGNPVVRKKILQEKPDNHYSVGPTLFFMDKKTKFNEIKQIMYLFKNRGDYGDDSINIYSETDKFMALFYGIHKKTKQKGATVLPLNNVKGSIIISQGVVSKSGSIEVHFCGYVFEDGVLHIFDPSHSKNTPGTFASFVDEFYPFLTKHRIQWQHVYENREYPWQHKPVLLKHDVFCQTWTLKWLLKPNDRNFKLPANALKAAQNVADYNHEFMGLIDEIREREKVDENKVDLTQLVPESRWNSHNPNDVLDYMRHITAGEIFDNYHENILDEEEDAGA